VVRAGNGAAKAAPTPVAPAHHMLLRRHGCLLSRGNNKDHWAPGGVTLRHNIFPHNDVKRYKLRATDGMTLDPPKPRCAAVGAHRP